MKQQTKQPTTSRIPAFKSREEEAEFWDTHDFIDYEDEFHPVNVRVVSLLSVVGGGNKHEMQKLLGCPDVIAESGSHS